MKNVKVKGIKKKRANRLRAGKITRRCGGTLFTKEGRVYPLSRFPKNAEAVR
jgi:hypothetical protein